jgi:hypothetical protein
MLDIQASPRNTYTMNLDSVDHVVDLGNLKMKGYESRVASIAESAQTEGEGISEWYHI